MGAFLVALVLVSGYVFVSKSVRQKLKTHRQDGHRYYFRCGAYGFIFSFIGLLLAVILDGMDFPSKVLTFVGYSVESLVKSTNSFSIHEYLSLKLAFGLFISPVIAFFCAVLDNYFRDVAKTKVSVQEDLCSPFEKFLSDCIPNFKTVLITLNNKKVYVGLVHDLPVEKAGDLEHVSIMPILSGYRDKDDLTVKFTTNYYIHYSNALDDNGEPVSGNGASLEDFVEIIPVSQIAHVGKFDIDTYKDFGKSNGMHSISAKNLDWMVPQSKIDEGKPISVELSK